MKFIHAADIHLDSPLHGLARYEGAPIQEMQVATRRALTNLIDLACNESVDFLLLAGDLYDGNWRDYNTGLFFHRQMNRLREAHIPVFITYGNHDAASILTRQLRLPENVTEFSSHHSETVILEQINVAIHGQSFATKAVTDDLSVAYPTALPGYFNIGLLHTSANGREGHSPYAPCAINTLLSKGYDYWALGHIHQFEIVHQMPHIVFAGNLQGRHVRETGPKGCVLVEVIGKNIQLTQQFVDVLRWESVQIDVTDVMHTDDLLDKVREEVMYLTQQAEGRPLAIRLVMRQISLPLYYLLQSNLEHWRNEIRAAIADNTHVWLEKIQFYVVEQTTDIADSMLGEIEKMVFHLATDETSLQGLAKEFRALKQVLPPEIGSTYNFDPEQPEIIQQMLHDAKALLLSRLSS